MTLTPPSLEEENSSVRAGFGIAWLPFVCACGSVEPTPDEASDADSDVDSDGPCSVDEDCGAPQPGGWSACEAIEACATAGERTREVEVPRCVDGGCTSEPTTEREDCPRETEGIPCGAEIPGDWGACGYPSSCAEEGTQERTVQTQVCRSGTCTLEDRVEHVDCARETDGDVCDDGDPCSPETHCTSGSCTGFICAPCPC